MCPSLYRSPFLVSIQVHLPLVFVGDECISTRASGDEDVADLAVSLEHLLDILLSSVTIEVACIVV